MSRALVTPLIKLSICSAVLIALLILWRCPIRQGFQGLAMATAILGASPATLLTAIEFGRVLRRQSISPAARRLMPQRLLGGIFCVAGVAELVVVIFLLDQPIPFRLLYCFHSLGIIVSAILMVTRTYD
jgi:hypothetical protein